LAPFNKYIFILFYLIPVCLFPQELPDKEKNENLLCGINFIINQNYKAAEAEFADLKKKEPNFPLWYVYYAASKITMAYDYGCNPDDKEIENNLNKALELSENLCEKDGNNIWNIYSRALSKGYLAYYHGLNESWFKAVKYGLGSVDDFETCLKKNPRFYDAYVGAGIFKYWKSRKSEFMSWLPIFGNQKEEGIINLFQAVKRNSYNSYIACYNLIWIMIEEEKYKEAADIALQALKKSPETRLFKWGYARACEAFDVKKAVEVYDEILESLLREGVSNHYKEVILKYTIARNLQKTGDKKRALKLCDEILQIRGMDSVTAKKLEDRIKKVKELKKELNG
jgi:tetratricopeptide (TPR) repeat protein